jgi:hypothetical protein
VVSQQTALDSAIVEMKSFQLKEFTFVKKEIVET